MPGCLFLAKDPAHASQIFNGFMEEGFRVEFLKSTEELKFQLTKQRNFLVFVNAEDFPDAINWLRTLGGIEKRRFFWIAMAKFSKATQAALFFQMGASDVLTPPVHPHLARGRAQLLIKRFLKIFDFPPNTILPSGITAPPRLKSHSNEDSGTDDSLLWFRGDRKKNPSDLKVLQQEIPFRDRYSPEQLKVVEGIYELFRRRSGWFEEVDGKKNQEALVSIASLQQASITLWCRNPRKRLDTTVIHYMPEEKIFILDPFSAEAFVKAAHGQTIFCHMRLDLASIFFVGKLLPSKGTLELGFPEKMYQVQRRGSLRMDLTTEMKRDLTLQLKSGEKLIAEVIDISSTGLQARVPLGSLDEVELMSIVQVNYEPEKGLSINGKCQVRWKTIKGEHQAFGLHFLGLSESMRDEIAFRIFEHFGQSFESIFNKKPS